ncbi:Vegetative incompatibility protein HET-E-1 [Neonectria ditissima]|uniref:Vegetative incompatibility protein HET-E-1 n=1 Tax=Neonectria ditissima TaxID=78410 RepID=A0A0P7BR89_9HYPO|nr:Vegetative incompatibility protein HET-E-1 [Neonectria ditissima]
MERFCSRLCSRRRRKSVSPSSGIIQASPSNDVLPPFEQSPADLATLRPGLIPPPFEQSPADPATLRSGSISPPSDQSTADLATLRPGLIPPPSDQSPIVVTTPRTASIPTPSDQSPADAATPQPSSVLLPSVQSQAVPTAPQASSIQSPSVQSQIELVAPQPTLNPGPPMLSDLHSPVPASVEEIRHQIWNEAYDELKLDEPSVIEAYEKILSAQLAERANPGLLADGNIIGQDAGARQAQMKELVDIGLHKTEKASKTKEKINEGMQSIKNIHNLISTAVKAEPIAAVAWVGVTTFMEVIANPVSEPGLNREGIQYVLDQTEWYWSLAERLLYPNKMDESMARLQSLLKVHVVKLYKALLLYQIQSVCMYHKHWAAVIMKDVVKLHDWQGKFDGIKTQESSLRDHLELYSSEVVKYHINHIAKDTAEFRENEAKKQEDEAKSQEDEANKRCLSDLKIVNPERDKRNIEKMKGTPLPEVYQWIFKHDDFQRFRASPEARLLWITGNPGKGKTMLLCGIIDELKKQSSVPISYFFCQAALDHRRDATSVLRGIIWLLCIKNPTLISYVRESYDPSEGIELINDLDYLEGVLTKMLNDVCLRDGFILVDALDECSDDSRGDLIDLITKFSTSSSAKWIVSSRNLWPVERELQAAQQIRLSLELNNDTISQAVKVFIRCKVYELQHYSQERKEVVLDDLLLKASDTFLWVALVCKHLAKDQDHALTRILSSIPAGLTELYRRMLSQVLDQTCEEICKRVLATACLAYRPVTVDELGALVASDEGFSQRQLENIIGECGSFLTVQDSLVYFVHQSAREFLMDKAKHVIFPLGTQHHHRLIFHGSLNAMKVLKRDMYDVQSPGALIEAISRPEPDPLSSLGYPCLYWVDHLKDIGDERGPSDDEAIGEFISKRFLYWLEALSLQRKMPEGTKALRTLSRLMKNVESTSVHGLKDLVEDARRFVHSHANMIVTAPLQTYASALVFSPTGSLIRKLFEEEEPDWIMMKPKVGRAWESSAQVLEGGGQFSNYSIAFSNDGLLLASSSMNGQVKIWDVASRHCIRTLDFDDTSTFVSSTSVPLYNLTVAFSEDDRPLVACASAGSIYRWDNDTGECTRTSLKDFDIATANLFFFSPGAKLLASTSIYGHLGIWNVADGCRIRMFSTLASTVAFSADGRQLATGFGRKVKIWDVEDWTCVWELQGHTQDVQSLAFVAEGTPWLTSSSSSEVKFWDLTKGICSHQVYLQSDPSPPIISSVSLGSGRSLAFASRYTISVLNDEGRHVLSFDKQFQILQLAFSNSAGRKVLASLAEEAIWLWELEDYSIIPRPKLMSLPENPEEHRYVGISPHSKWVASETAGNLEIWNTANGNRTLQLENPGSFAFSPNDEWFMTRRDSGLAFLRNATTGARIEAFDDVSQWVFSEDSRFLAIARNNSTVDIWDMASKSFIQSLKSKVVELTFPTDSHHVAPSITQEREIRICELRFSFDNRHLAICSSKYEDRWIEVWDVNTTIPMQKDKRRADTPIFSLDCDRDTTSQSARADLATAVEPCDTFTPRCIWKLKHYCNSLAISSDFRWLATYQIFGLRIWNLKTGALVHKVQIDLGLICFSWALSDRHLAIACPELLLLWDFRTGACIWNKTAPNSSDSLKFDNSFDSLLSSSRGILDLNTATENTKQIGLEDGLTYRGCGLSRDGEKVMNYSYAFVKTFLSYPTNTRQTLAVGE